MPAESLAGKSKQDPLHPAVHSESLRDKTAVVTGASSGIGRSIAIALAAAGSQVFLVGRRPGSLEEVRKHLNEHFELLRVCQLDLTRDEDIHALATDLRKRTGGVDVLVHSAGEIYHAEHANALLTDLDAQYRANVRAPYLLTQSLLPLLRVGPGQIVFINSTSGLHARARTGQFAATQHAMKAIADSLREEVNADGIRVLSVYPGRTATPRTQKLFNEEGKDYQPELMMQPEDVAAMVVHSLRLPRTAEVTEISMRSLLKSY